MAYSRQLDFTRSKHPKTKKVYTAQWWKAEYILHRFAHNQCACAMEICTNFVRVVCLCNGKVSRFCTGAALSVDQPTEELA